MIIKYTNNSLLQIFHAAVFLGAMWWCIPLHALEAPSEPPAALTRIQTLTDRTSELIMRAMGLIGIQYKYGGDSPESGMDCSGLVRYVFKEAWGAILPRTSEEISQLGQPIEPHELRPGDLVFYNTLKRAFSHVGIYLGESKFVHSPAPGGEVRVERMDVSYWKKRFNGARRMVDPAYAPFIEMK